MNSCQFVGRLTAEPELRRTNDGTAVCSYSLVVKRPGVKDVTDFLDFVSWRQGAEFLAKYGHKGDTVAVSGQLQTREWTDKNGNKRRAFEVITSSVEPLSSRRNSRGGSNTGSQANGNPGGLSDVQQGYGQSGYSQQGFGGYGDYQALSVDDPKLPF